MIGKAQLVSLHGWWVPLVLQGLHHIQDSLQLVIQRVDVLLQFSHDLVRNEVMLL